VGTEPNAGSGRTKRTIEQHPGHLTYGDTAVWARCSGAVPPPEGEQAVMTVTMSAPAGLGAWRAQLLDRVLWVMLLIGVVVAVPSVWLSLASGFPHIAVVDVLALAVVATLKFSTRLTYRVRTGGLLLTVFLLGSALLPVVGLVGYLYLGAVPVLGALLLGSRVAVGALVLYAIVVTVVGAVGQTRDWLLVAGVQWPVEWGVVTVNALFVSGILALSSTFLLRRLEGAEADAARLAVAVANAPDALVVADPSGRIVSMNRTAATLAERLTDGDGWDRLEDLAQTSEQREQLRGAVAQGVSISLGMHRRFGSGVVELAGQVTPIHQAEGQLHSIVAVFRDVTHERRTEAGLRRAEKLEALSVLASTTAHDFNNVLAQILAVAEGARSDPDPGRIGADLDAIVGASERARDLVEQLAAFGARAEQARSPVDVGRVVEDSLPLLRAALSSTGVRIEPQLDDGAFVAARASEIEQIVSNLVTNAAQATATTPDPVVSIQVVRPAGSPATAGPRLGSEPDAVVVRVSDNGRGIEAQHLERIFEPFFTTRGSSGGTGLGLASVRSIAASLGGRAEVASPPGRGATFVVTIPAAGEPPATDAAPDVTGQVLLVDDEPLLRDLAAQGLTRAGYEVVTAADGEQALELFTRAPDRFGLLVTDLNMPGVDGSQLIAEVRRLRPEQPVVVCSGQPDGAPTGVERVGWLAKPYTLTELRRTVEVAMGQRAASELGRPR
jgi:PAS domain S-box-containing protein